MSNRRHTNQLHRRIHLLIVLALLLSALTPALGVAQAQAQGAETAPPVLLSTTPAEGAAWDGGPLSFAFNKELSDAQILVSPPLAGATGIAGNEAVFTPGEAPAADIRYRFTVAAATAQDGSQMTAARTLTVIAAGPPAVSATQPADGSEDVDPNGAIIVIFNRPIVALGGSQAESLPQPLSFDPPVAGQGRWISTSVYQWTPDAPLAGGAGYQATVAPVSDAAGAGSSAGYSFAFTTASPIVLGSTPAGIFARPDTAVRVTFSQPMDAASSAAAFSLTPIDPPGEAVTGETGWITDTTLVFTPTAPLDYGTEYLVQVADTAQPAGQGGGLRQPYQSTFTVVPLPDVLSATIANEAEAVDPEAELRIRFSAPVSETTVLQNITITPLPDATTVVSYTYSDYYENTQQNSLNLAQDAPSGYYTHLVLNWYRQPETTYTVSIGGESGAGVLDQFGNPLVQPYTLTFTTGSFQPMIGIDLDRFTHYSAITTTVVGVRYRNLETVDADLYRLPLDDLYLLAGENQWQVWDSYQLPNRDEALIWSKSAQTDGPANVINRVGFKLVDADGNPLPPGVYLLEVHDPLAAPNPQNPDLPAVQRAVIVLSNNNITFKRALSGDSLAWVTDLQSGQPAAGVDVSFGRNGMILGNATTDADGLALADLAIPSSDQYLPFFATSGEPGDPNFAVVSSEWNTGIEPWSFNLNSGGSSDGAIINLYSERPLYQAGQTVYWKGIVRLLDNDQWAVPGAGETLRVRITDGMGNVVLDQPYTTDALGTLHGEFALAPDAPSGWYSINTEYQPQGVTLGYGSASFIVAAYVKPEFQIDVQSDQPEYVQGDTIHVDVQASYFSGGPLVGAPVEWRLIANTWSFTWPDAPAGSFYSFDPFDPDQADYNPYADSYLGLVQEGKGTTDAQGRFTIELPADLGASLASQRWSLDIIITSPTSQQVYNNVTFPVHRGAYYIGLSPRSYVVAADEQAQVDALTVTPQGERYADADLDVTVYEFRWNSVYAQAEDGNFYWQTTADRTPVYTTTVTTDAQGEGVITFTPAAGGQYQVTAQGEDAAGNTIRSAAFLWVASAGYVPWKRENNDRLELVADKPLYAPGDTAKILIPNPFTGTVEALVTLERGGVMQAQVIELTGSSQTVAVPLTSAMIPNVFVGVVLVKGVDESNPFVATRVGYVALNVDTSEKELTIDVQPSAQTVAPGDTVTYTLTLRDSQGNPAADVSNSVALVDKAVLALGAGYMDSRSLVDIFYYARPLGVATGSLIVINKDRVSAQLAEGGKGGGGGGGDGGPDVREEFPDTAFWRADFLSDENGVIEFAVTLPDNLTTWVLTAKGVDAQTRVGEATNEIVATKPLQVRPGLPRFLVAGDRAVIGGQVINLGADAIDDITFTIDAAGGVLEAETNSAEPFSLQHPGDYVYFSYPLAVDDTAASVVVTMTAQAGDGADGLADAVRVTIPVLRYQTPETVGASGVVNAETGAVTEAVYPPATATDDGELRLTLDPSLAAGMLNGLDYLAHFPYECTEQTVSRFLPNLFSLVALQSAGLETGDLAQQLDSQLNIGVQTLVSRQNPDGGWGFWPQQQSSPFITAYALWGLWNAQQMDYTVDANVLTRAVTYLDQQFVAPDSVTMAAGGDWQLNEMAFVHYVLAQMDYADPGRMSTLYEVRERLEPYGRAFLAMALYRMDRGDERVATLAGDLLGEAILTAGGAFWQDETLDFPTMSSDVRTTAIVLDALIQIMPDQPLLANAVRWLMTVREDGRWRTTQENAWSIIALTDWMEQTGELEAGFDWDVTLGDSALGSGRFDDPQAQEELTVAVSALLRDQANLLRIGRSATGGPLYYSLQLAYNLPAAEVQPADRGMVIDRRFFLDGEEVSEVKVGDVVSVTVTIVAPTNLYHVLVEAPVPAGAEPLDPNLPTGFQYDQQGQPILRPLDASAGGWAAWTPASLDYRADKVALFATFLPAGSYQYTFTMRAAFAGEYNVLPAHGEMMYFPDVWGRSAGGVFTIK